MKRRNLVRSLALEQYSNPIAGGTCPNCGGKRTCHVCDGTGTTSTGGYCPVCGGNGKCAKCGGTGVYMVVGELVETIGI